MNIVFSNTLKYNNIRYHNIDNTVIVREPRWERPGGGHE